MTTGPIPAATPEPSSAPQASSSMPESAPPRRLLRSHNDRMITGLAAGIARHFEIDPVIVRAAFVLLALANGVGVVLYIVGSIIVPSDDGTPLRDELRRHDVDRAGRILGIVFGCILISFGVGALLENLQGITIDWLLVACSALIAVGALLVVTLGRVARGGLVAIGVILSVMLAPLSAANMVVGRDAFGDRFAQPANVTELQQRYEHAFGSMTIDLRNLAVPEGTTTVRAQSAFGSLTVFVPKDVAVEVVGETTFGNIEALGQDLSAGPVQRHAGVRTPDYNQASKRISLQVTSAFGSVEVIR